MGEDSNEDLLDVFATQAMNGYWAHNGYHLREKSDGELRTMGRLFYRQAQAMLLVRKEFLKDQG